MEENVDYKALYLKMMQASEDAIRLLIQAQQECEEQYLSMNEQECKVETDPTAT